MEPGSLPVQSSLWTARCRAVRCGLPGAGPLHGWRGRVWRRAVSHRPRTISPLLGLAPGGGYLAVRIAANAGGLLRHLFTITTRVAVCFCGPFRQVHASRRFPRPGCYPTPCSMECGLSSTPSTQGRDCPIGLRDFIITDFWIFYPLIALPFFFCCGLHGFARENPSNSSDSKRKGGHFKKRH